MFGYGYDLGFAYILSPTYFCIVYEGLDRLRKLVEVYVWTMRIWVFNADGVILQAESQSDLQDRLNLVFHKWIVVVNQITHRRNKSMERSQENFYFDSVASERVG